jgi:hypothetical protein
VIGQLVDFGPDPVHGERHEPDTDVWVEAFHGLHQADVAFLDKVTELQAVTGIAASHVNHETQVGKNQVPGCIEVVGLA